MYSPLKLSTVANVPVRTQLTANTMMPGIHRPLIDVS